MPTVLLFAIVMFVLGGSAWADQGHSSVQSTSLPQASCEDCVKQADQSADERIGKRGCCSHHGGVCGCGGVRLRCCDGTLSPSCRCDRPDVQGDSSPTPVPTPVHLSHLRTDGFTD